MSRPHGSSGTDRHRFPREDVPKLTLSVAGWHLQPWEKRLLRTVTRKESALHSTYFLMFSLDAAYDPRVRKSRIYMRKPQKSPASKRPLIVVGHGSYGLQKHHNNLSPLWNLNNTLETRLLYFHQILPRLDKRRDVLDIGGNILKSSFGVATDLELISTNHPSESPQSRKE